MENSLHSMAKDQRRIIMEYKTQERMLVRIKTNRQITAIRRGNAVMRMHSEHPINRENVGHHTANLIGLIIAVYSPTVPPASLLVAAAMHDLPEAETGDVPATTKWRSPVIKKELTRLEQEFYEEQKLPNPDFLLTPEESNLLSVLDSYDLMLWCLDQASRGWIMGTTIAGRLEAYLRYCKINKPLDSQFDQKVWDLIFEENIHDRK